MTTTRTARPTLTGQVLAWALIIFLVIGFAAWLRSLHSQAPAAPSIGDHTIGSLHCQEDEAILLTKTGPICKTVDDINWEPVGIYDGHKDCEFLVGPTSFIRCADGWVTTS